MNKLIRNSFRDLEIKIISNLYVDFAALTSQIVAQNIVDSEEDIPRICETLSKKIFEIADDTKDNSIDFWTELKGKNEILHNLHSKVTTAYSVLNKVLKEGRNGQDVSLSLFKYEMINDSIADFDYKDRFFEFAIKEFLKQKVVNGKSGKFLKSYKEIKNQAIQLDIDREIVKEKDYEIAKLVVLKEREILENIPHDNNDFEWPKPKQR